MTANVRNLSLILVSATSLVIVGCGGTKVVVVPTPTTPAANTIVTPAATPVVVSVPPTPAPVQEAESASPGSNYVWVAGYYNWVGNRYVWVPGMWVSVPHPNAMWVPAHWQPTTGGYTWMQGHWQ
jgi:hypothetical protein